MVEREWKLGKDLCLEDNLLDPITFEEVVMTMQCNCSEINQKSLEDVIYMILSHRTQDLTELFLINRDEILEEVKRRKGIV